MVTQLEDVFSRKKGDPMSQPRTAKYLFLHPRHERLPDTIKQILLDAARDMLVLLVWKNSPHFWRVGEIAVDCWDCPPKMPIYNGPKPSWTTHIVPFDLMTALDLGGSSCMV